MVLEHQSAHQLQQSAQQSSPKEDLFSPLFGGFPLPLAPTRAPTGSTKKERLPGQERQCAFGDRESWLGRNQSTRDFLFRELQTPRLCGAGTALP